MISLWIAIGILAILFIALDIFYGKKLKIISVDKINGLLRNIKDNKCDIGSLENNLSINHKDLSEHRLIFSALLKHLKIDITTCTHCNGQGYLLGKDKITYGLYFKEHTKKHTVDCCKCNRTGYIVSKLEENPNEQ